MPPKRSSAQKKKKTKSIEAPRVTRNRAYNTSYLAGLRSCDEGPETAADVPSTVTPTTRAEVEVRESDRPVQGEPSQVTLALLAHPQKPVSNAPTPRLPNHVITRVPLPRPPLLLSPPPPAPAPLIASPALRAKFTDTQIAQAQEQHANNMRQIDLRTRRPYSSVPAILQYDPMTAQDFGVLASEFTKQFKGEFELVFQFSLFMWMVAGTRTILHLKLDYPDQLRAASQWVTERNLADMVAAVSPEHLDNTYMDTKRLVPRYNPEAQFLLMITTDLPRPLVCSVIMDSPGILGKVDGHLPVYYYLNRFILRCVGCDRAFQKFGTCHRCQSVFACMDKVACMRTQNAFISHDDPEFKDRVSKTGAWLVGKPLLDHHVKHKKCAGNRTAGMKAKFDEYQALLMSDSKLWRKLVLGQLPVDLHAAPERELEIVTAALEHVRLEQQLKKKEETEDGAEHDTYLSDQQVMDIMQGLGSAREKKTRRMPARRAKPTHLAEGGAKQKKKAKTRDLGELFAALAKAATHKKGDVSDDEDD